MTPPTHRERAAMRQYLDSLEAFMEEAQSKRPDSADPLRWRVSLLPPEAMVRGHNAFRMAWRNGTITGADPPSPGAAPTGGQGDGKGGGRNAGSSDTMRSSPLPPPQAPSPPAGKCPEHGKPWKMVPAGVSRRTGEKYAAFWACPVMGCRKRPPKEARP